MQELIDTAPYKELSDQKEAILAQARSVEDKLADLRESDFCGLVDEIADLCSFAGFDPNRLASEILRATGKKANGKGNGKRKPNYLRDKTDHSKRYSQGPTPKWMKKRMLAEGFDPSDKEERNEFKSQFLERVPAA